MKINALFFVVRWYTICDLLVGFGVFLREESYTGRPYSTCFVGFDSKLYSLESNQQQSSSPWSKPRGLEPPNDAQTKINCIIPLYQAIA